MYIYIYKCTHTQLHGPQLVHHQEHGVVTLPQSSYKRPHHGNTEEASKGSPRKKRLDASRPEGCGLRYGICWCGLRYGIFFAKIEFAQLYYNDIVSYGILFLKL